MIFISQSTLDRIKEVAKSAEGEAETLHGIRIKVIEDPGDRCKQALKFCFSSGIPVMFESEDGQMLRVHAPEGTPWPEGIPECEEEV